MTQLTICACKRGSKVEEVSLQKWKEELSKANIAYTLIDDMCGLATQDSINHSLIKNEEKHLLLGCQPKAMNNLVKHLGIDSAEHNIDLRNLNESSTDLISKMEFTAGEPRIIAYNDNWKPWYPVLDYDVCNSCQKCLNFCLFGVYKLNYEGKVIDENPENCKDLCPACARTCPTNAIIFPKHHESPIDGGEAEKSIAVGNILDGIQQSQDVYKLLANRRKASGIPLFKADQLQIAKQERDQCKCNDKK
jgi:NAD-dependent dihydropyrimidine dehydrogenase PreA subunit